MAHPDGKLFKEQKTETNHHDKSPYLGMNDRKQRMICKTICLKEKSNIKNTVFG